MNQTIQLGSNSEAVAQARAMLEQIGYSVPGEPNVFGPTMQAAVISFQKDSGLKPDGVVGPATWAALEQAFSKNVEQPVSARDIQTMSFPEDIIEGSAPPNNVALIAGLLVAAAVWYFTNKEQKEGATGDWENDEGPEVKRRVKRISREQKRLKKPKSQPHEVVDMEIDELPEDERGAIIVHTNAKMFKSQREYREDIKQRADEQAADTGRDVKVVDSKSGGKVLYHVEA